MKKIFTAEVLRNKSVPILFSIGFLSYLFLVIRYAQTVLPNLDEGAYLLKGLYYTTGKVAYFGDYGFWTNYMFLSFFPWGWIQQIFGSGLLTARTFAIFLNISSVLAIWLILREIAPRWTIVLAIWILFADIPLIKILSRANSQVLVNFLILWAIYFCVKKGGKILDLIIASILLAALILTRENMIFIMLPWAVFVFWDRGWKQGLVGLIIFGVVFIVGQSFFFPNILALWLRFLPSNWFNDPTLNLMGLPYKTDLKETLFSKFISLSYGIRHYYLQVFGFLIGAIYMIKNWKTQIGSRGLKLGVFLSTTFFILLLLHAYASIGLQYCTFCFSTYMAFFVNVAMIFVLVQIEQASVPIKGWGYYLTIIFAALTFFPLWLAETNKFSHLFSSITFQFPGSSKHIMLGNVIINKFGFDSKFTEIGISMIVAIFVFCILLIGITSIQNRYHTIAGIRKWLTVPSLLFVCLLCYSVYDLSDSMSVDSCDGNVVNWYQDLGRQMKNDLPENATIYLNGPITTLPIVYLENSNIFLPQANGSYTFIDQPDNDFLLKNGFWNNEVRKQWLEKANVLLIERSSQKEMSVLVDLTRYTEKEYYYQPGQCGKQIEYLLYLKK